MWNSVVGAQGSAAGLRPCRSISKTQTVFHPKPSPLSFETPPLLVPI